MRCSSRFLLSTALVLCLVAALGGGAHAAEMRIAILEFTNASKDPELAALGKGLQSMVTTDLANVSTIQVVERERLKDVQGELKLSSGAGFDKTTAARIGKLAGASHLFVGSFTVVGEQMRLDGRLLVVQTGEVVLAQQIAGEKALFFELEQKLVEKVIALLGVKVAPKEKAALARAHTADFQAFKKFSDGIQAFDDGRLQEAVKYLNEATAIDKDFKLASLTLDEYERLATQVRAKADAARNVEDEVARLAKTSAISAEVDILRKLWPMVEAKGNSPDAKLQRVAAACALSNHYRTQLGYQNRGPVTSEDLARAGFDRFTLRRTSEALAARAWAEALDVFPKIAPMCAGFGMVSSTNKLPIAKQLEFLTERSAKLTEDAQTLISHMRTDDFAEVLHLDAAGEIKLVEKIYALVERMPDLKDEDRVRFEERLAKLRREIADFDGSTKLYAQASRRTQRSHQLKEFASEIDKNKALKLAWASASPAAREKFLIGRGSESDLGKPRDAKAEDRLIASLETAREIHHNRDSYLLFGDIPVWSLLNDSWATRARTGPRTSRLRTNELRCEATAERDTVERGKTKPRATKPFIVGTPVRAKRFTVKAQIDQVAPPEWESRNKTAPGAGEAGVAFAISRLEPEGGIDEKAPAITVAYAVLVGTGRARLVQLRRNGDHSIDVDQLAEAPLAGGRAERRPLEVTVEPGSVVVRVDGKRAAFPFKPASEADGFVGFIFSGNGYSALSSPSITSSVK